MKNMYKNSMLNGKLKIMNNIDKYVLNEKNKIYKFPLEEIEEEENEMNIKFPAELREFYEKYGYGKINDMNFSCFNRLLAPLQCASIRLRRDYYEYDPELESYKSDELIYNRMIFFQVNEGSYLTISLDEGEKSAIYYGDVKIADSLEEFLIKMYDDGTYYFDL